MSAFFRFPHTPHIAWLGKGSPRDDKVLSGKEVEALLDGPVIVEEKIDGANLGISVNVHGALQAQNRGHYLQPPYTGQFSRLGGWLTSREVTLIGALGQELIAFGEWCAARHSLQYLALPDWWLLFDVYDRSAEKFWSTARRDAWAQMLGLPTIRQIYAGKASLSSLTDIVRDAHSAYRAGPLEGIVIRRERDGWLEQRAKLVRADFTQNIEAHWRQRGIEWNRVKSSDA